MSLTLIRRDLSPSFLHTHPWAARALRGEDEEQGRAFLLYSCPWAWVLASLLGPGNCSLVPECLCSMSGAVKLLGAPKNAKEPFICGFFFFNEGTWFP